MLVSLETKINGRGLDVDTQLPEEPVMVWGDPDGITQVCYNLLDNAAKFAAQGTAITVQITKKDGKAYIAVRNSGRYHPARTSCLCCSNDSTRRTPPAAWTGRAWGWACILSRRSWAT